jgi:2TM domain
MDEKEIYRKAKRRVEAKLAFYTHLAIYIVVNIFLTLLNLMTSPQHYWFQWPLMGWGIGLVIHAFQVFPISNESSLKSRLIEKEIEKTSIIEE